MDLRKKNPIFPSSVQDFPVTRLPRYQVFPGLVNRINSLVNVLFFWPCPLECIPRLVSVAEHPEAKAVENGPATDNAVSAIVKIIQFNCTKINPEELNSRLVSWLPIVSDEEEAVHVYSYMCDLLDKWVHVWHCMSDAALIDLLENSSSSSSLPVGMLAMR